MLGAREEVLVGVDREIERFVVLLRAGERGRVVGEVGAGEIVLGEAVADLLPAACGPRPESQYALARITSARAFSGCCSTIFS
ncbi:MAG: hypothetical protein MUF40_03540 [Gemmatimonadaceae bacterium]|nr:hypothetical protein [Gemmatimonadaceae bacterium]